MAIPIYTSIFSIQAPFSTSPSLPTLVISYLLNNSRSSRCQVSLSVWFSFPNDLWYWASFHVPNGLLNVSIVKCLFSSSASFKIRLFVFLSLSWVSSLYILNINHWSSIWFANIFSHSVGYLLILLIVFLCCAEALVWYSSTLFLHLLPWFLVSWQKSLPR